MVKFQKCSKQTAVRITAVILILPFLLISCQLAEDIAEELGLQPTEQASEAIAVEETAVSIASDVTAAATAVPFGQSRAEPHSGQESVSLTNWKIEIVDTVRGERAWHVLSAANQFNDPPPDGWEYLLVRYQIENLRQDEDESSLGLHVTGSNSAIHYSFNNNAVAPDPTLETYLPGGGKSNGWDAYLIRIGEDNLMLVVTDFSNFDEPDQYIAIEEGASITANNDLLQSLTPTLDGTEPNEPALVGNLVTAEDWRVMVLEAYRGEEAWQRILEANQFNDPPQYGFEYVLVKLRVHYIGLEEAGQNISSYNDIFVLLNEDGVVQDQPSIVEPAPALDGYLFPNGELEGWLVFQASETEVTGSYLLFQPRNNLVENLRYLSLLDYGR